MRRGVLGVRRHRRRAVAFEGVRRALAGHGTHRRNPPPALRRVVAPSPVRVSLAMEWAVRSW
jgi:hypothetical protein